MYEGMTHLWHFWGWVLWRRHFQFPAADPAHTHRATATALSSASTPRVVTAFQSLHRWGSASKKRELFSVLTACLWGIFLCLLITLSTNAGSIFSCSKWLSASYSYICIFRKESHFWALPTEMFPKCTYLIRAELYEKNREKFRQEKHLIVFLRLSLENLIYLWPFFKEMSRMIVLYSGLCCRWTLSHFRGCFIFFFSLWRKAAIEQF